MSRPLGPILVATLLACHPSGALPDLRTGPLDYHVSAAVAPDQVRVAVCGDPDERFDPWAFELSSVALESGRVVGGHVVADAEGCVRYRVRRGISRGDASVWVTTQDRLFVRPTRRRDATVTFQLAAGQDVATVWPGRREASGLVSFDLPARGLGLPSDIVLGRFTRLERDIPGANLQFVRAGRPLAYDDATLADHVASAAAEVAGVVGRFPTPRVLAIAVGARSERAVAFGLTRRGGGGSIVLLVGSPAVADVAALREDWVTSHELSHLLHPSLGSADRWLSEGLATYYQEVLRARSGWQTPERAWARIADGLRRGALDGTGRTLEDEAESMRRTAAFQRVYWGGAAFALEADIQLRRQGGSLDQALARCLHQIRRTTRVVPRARFLRSLSGELLPLAESYATREAFPDLRNAFARLGVEVGADGEVTLVDAPEARIRDAIMRRSGSAGPFDR